MYWFSIRKFSKKDEHLPSKTRSESGLVSFDNKSAKKTLPESQPDI